MCGRFHFNGNDKDIQKILDELPESENNIQIKFGDIYPTYYLPIITQEEHPILSKWGFGKFDGKGVLINARAETVTDTLIMCKNKKAVQYNDFSTNHLFVCLSKYIIFSLPLIITLYFLVSTPPVCSGGAFLSSMILSMSNRVPSVHSTAMGFIKPSPSMCKSIETYTFS